MSKTKRVAQEFCMSQFKPAVASIVVLAVMVIAWATWNCRVESLQRRRNAGFALAAVTKPPAKAISVKDKAPHPYWGNCNQCHITVDPPANPVSKVFAGAPISIKAPMPHEYWGNCNLCHKVVDGFQPPKKAVGNAKAAAFNRVTSRTLGLKLQSVTADMMRKFGLADEDGVLVLEVAPGSIAEKSGLLVGDEIVRVGNALLDTVADFDFAVGNAEPGSIIKFNLYRGKKGRNLFVEIPAAPAMAVNPVAATLPMTQNRTETRAGQLYVPSTQQAHVDTFPLGIGNNNIQFMGGVPVPTGIGNSQSLIDIYGRNTQQGQQTMTAGVANYGKVAVASLGPDIYSQVASQFCASPYFIVFDPVNNSSRKVANPNFNDNTGRGIQTGQYMVDLGVKNVIAGNYSANSYNTLRSLHLNAYSGVTGSVNNVLSMYRNGQLQPNTVNAHAGVAGQSLQGTPTAPPLQGKGIVF